MNVNIPQLADTLFERTASTSWRFIQYMASRNTLFNLSNFLDKSGLQGYDMSTFIRRYSRYLNEKAVSYRHVAFDFTKVKRGADGVMRTMNTEKLLKTIPIVQNQMDALLDFNVNANELTNGVINAAFMLLFKDSIRLFAAYNEGIINLLEKYFDMKKTQCKEGLDVYKKFLTRMTRISEFLKVAEAPSSLLDALEQHLASLEGKKVKDSTAASRASTLSNAVSSLANTGISFTKVDEREKQAALEEEQARLKALKEHRLKELQKGPSFSATTAASPVTSKAASDLLDLQPAFQQQALPISSGLPTANTWGDPFISTEAVYDSIPNFNPFLSHPVVDAVHLPVESSDGVSSRTPSHEMFGDHYNPFIDSSTSIASDHEHTVRIEQFISDSFCGPASYPTTPLFQSEPPAVAGLFGGFSASPTPQPQTARGLNVDFDSVFGNNVDSAGGILIPTVASSPSQVLTPCGQQPGKLVSDDLDSSLANLPGEKKLTGGNNWQPKTAPSTTWNPAT
ncbi:unnamed protein product, partial [Coregonus sp. 'balchen']